MKKINFEFKAKAVDLDGLEARFLSLNPVFKGEDHQIDTYFAIARAGARLKLREGNIENSLILYERANVGAAKQSDVVLYEHAPSSSLKSLLTQLHGIKTVVDKRRRIYFIDNVKFHFDRVVSLGTFVEVEAIADDADDLEKLKAQCQYYFDWFGLSESDYVEVSYSDLLLAK